MIYTDDFSSIYSLCSLGSLNQVIYWQTILPSLAENRYFTQLYIYDPEKKATRQISEAMNLKVVGQSEQSIFLCDKGDRQHSLYTWDEQRSRLQKRFTGELDMVKVEAKKGTCVMSCVHCRTEHEPNQPDFGKVDSENLFEIHELPFSYNGKGLIPGTIHKLYSLEGEQVEPITPDSLDVLSFCVADDGQEVYFVAQEKAGLDKENQQLFVYDVKTKHVQNIFPFETVHYMHCLCTQGENIYFTSADAEKYGYGQSPHLITMNRQTKAVTARECFDRSIGLDEITTDIKMGDHNLFACADQELTFGMTDRYHTHLYQVRDKQAEPLFDFEGSVLSFTGHRKRVYFIAQKTGGLDELYVYDGQHVEPITHFNAPYLAQAKPNLPIHFSVKNEEFGDLDAFIIEPQNYDSSKRYPAILDIHGGPRMAYGDGFFHEMQLWSSQGYFVVYGNPRGSAGRGDGFANARMGRMAYEPYDDLMTILDEAIRRYPAIDTDQLMVTGGSYGGYMTNWIVGHTDRFKAAVTQRSITNWVSQTLQTDVANVSFRRFFYHAEEFWDNIDMMWELSPLKYARQITTPLMFIHSADDLRCPLSQAIQLYNALKILNKETALNIFKEETHELSRSGKPANRFLRLKLITDWFDQHRS